MSYIVQVGPRFMAVAVLVGACGRSENPRGPGAETGAADSAGTVAADAATGERRVSNVMIGKHVGPNGRVTEPSFQFAPQDTVHVSVAIEGVGGDGTLTVAWRSQGGEILEQSSEQVRPAGENTAFHLARPAGLKPGNYKVVVFLGGDSVDAKVFAVRK